MDIFKLFAGLTLVAVFGWLLIRNSGRRGFVHALFRFDTIVGILAGAYLTVSSLTTLFF